ncbi:fatty acid desaturase domain-containing protein [Ditylenchus destructor]|uniref:Fatty acid desaturase domain-containing protein n=1 Tax=Ditylenchus destructor TaxID=166010 RepID=A0AAD4MZZ5_9BILA|nr:fatty acid desaturase domain-containing protein [Ditylenchus destructor]
MIFTKKFHGSDQGDLEPIKSVKEQYLATEDEEISQLRDQAIKENYKLRFVWKMVFFYSLIHLGGLIGFYQFFFSAKWMTVIWTILLWGLSVLGITAGAHRLWSHKCYKANTPLKLILVAMQTMAYQNDVIDWARDHRCHHKWTDTDADPHNVNRGFWFSHIGWLVTRKHPKIKEMGGKLDLSDLISDPILMFQRRHYIPLVLLMCFFIPTIVPVFLWKETPMIAFFTAGLLRLCLALHSIFFVNSVAHTFGYRMYDINISPTENFWMNVATLGEGGHNYHHVFPQDYRTSELTMFNVSVFNFTVGFIELFAKIGWAYDLKTTSKDVVMRQVNKQLQLARKEKAG